MFYLFFQEFEPLFLAVRAVYRKPTPNVIEQNCLFLYARAYGKKSSNEKLSDDKQLFRKVNPPMQKQRRQIISDSVIFVLQVGRFPLSL